MADGDIVEVLRLLRLKKRKSQLDTADRIGVSHRTLQAWELRIHPPILPNLQAWANALGMEVVLKELDDGSTEFIGPRKGAK